VTHTELDLRERRVIEYMLHAKMFVHKIAAEIGRHCSTIYRDIKRNGFVDDELPKLNGYYGMVAQKLATQRRARRRKLVRLVDLRTAVIAQLKEGWSPEQIAGRLQFEGQPVRVSHETIYAYVYGPDGQSKELARQLPNRRKKRRPHHSRKPRGLVLPPVRSIHERPDYVKTRSTFGEWEGDLMTVLEPLPQPARRSITFDRGIEFRHWRKLKPGIGTEAWFCDPQAPWQKGSVENLNR